LNGQRVTASTFSRRAVLRAGALSVAALAAGRAIAPLEAEADVTQDQPLPQGRYTLDADWLFGGVYAAGSEQPGYSEAGFSTVSLPHTVAGLSWGNWIPSSWESLWIYRKHINQAAVSGGRVFVDFQGVMTTATVWLNGTLLAVHQGGYLPFSVELTEELKAGDNVLAVQVNAELQDVPPSDLAGGDASIDFLQPGGIYRDVTLRIVPEVQITDLFAKPVNVLTAPGLDVQVTIDAAATSQAVTVAANLLTSSGAQVASASTTVAVTQGRSAQVNLAMANLQGISLWSPESPTLYQVQATVTLGRAVDAFTITTGFREAIFQTDGFYLNGARYEIFGLNRHQLFPYTGMAAPARLQARDAAILKNELNCNMVRCSHYPQSEYFLDACDALGLMVWQETPGWEYVGDEAFRQIAVQNVEDMILRDRSRPSIILWATRLNESSNSATNQSLYAQTNQIAADLDGTRPTTGAMDIYSTSGWSEQVFAYDDYHSVNSQGQQASLFPPLPGVPYMVSEAVGAVTGAPLYRWIDPQATLALQGTLHAEVHNIVAGNPAYAGLLGWCAVDYQSLNGGTRLWQEIKWAGITDTFRVPKPAAGFYASQIAPATTPVIVPGFFWDFGPASPASGPGSTVVFTNCDELQFYVGSATTPTFSATPDTTDYPNLAYPPAVVNFPTVDGSSFPSLRIEGLVSGEVVTELRMSSNTSDDTLALTLEASSISADGTDTTRFTLRGVDAYGNHRPLASSDTSLVTLAVSGPGTLIADNPFEFGLYGGVGGGFLRSQAGATGTVTLTASHPTLGTATASLTTVAGSPAPGSLGSSYPRVLTAPPAAAGAPRRPKPRPEADAAFVRRTEDAKLRAALRKLLTPHGLHARIEYLLRHGYTLSFRAPGPGHLVLGWYRVTKVRVGRDGHHHEQTRRVLIASASVHIRTSGAARVTIHLTARGRTLLRHAQHEQLDAEAEFTPKGRRRVTVSRTINLRR
jgi:beta-galactosidase